MSEERSYQTAQTSAGTVDAALRQHMLSVYNRMSVGVLVTGLVAFVVANAGLVPVIMGNPIIAIALMLSPLAVVWFGFNPMTMSSQKLRASFLLLSVLYGLSFSVIFLAYSGTDIARAFFITAASFAGLSVFGYTTKKNLDAMGTFAVMGVIGALVLGLVNMFLQSSMLLNIVSVVSVIAFAGITAWETQRMKESFHPSYGDEANSRMAWSSALNLYMSFVAMFQSILRLMSVMRGD